MVAWLSIVRPIRPWTCPSTLGAAPKVPIRRAMRAYVRNVAAAHRGPAQCSSQWAMQWHRRRTIAA